MKLDFLRLWSVEGCNTLKLEARMKISVSTNISVLGF